MIDTWAFAFLPLLFSIQKDFSFLNASPWYDLVGHGPCSTMLWTRQSLYCVFASWSVWCNQSSIKSFEFESSELLLSVWWGYALKSDSKLFVRFECQSSEHFPVLCYHCICFVFLFFLTHMKNVSLCDDQWGHPASWHGTKTVTLQFYQTPEKW